MNKFATIILAAGMGKRMKSDLPKVLHKLAGRPLLHWVIEQSEGAGGDMTVVVVGHKKELVIESVADMNVEIAVQEQQLGTADAVLSAKRYLEGWDGDILILSGDVPLLQTSTIRAAYDVHKREDASCTVFTFEPESPSGYGRVIRSTDGLITTIVEEKDANSEQKLIREVNAGIYFYRSVELWESLSKVDNKNAAGEFYVTDTISILCKAGKRVLPYLVDDPLETSGVNSPEQLLELEQIVLDRAR